jgi:hypothetical protein
MYFLVGVEPKHALAPEFADLSREKPGIEALFNHFPA